jgi:catechol 2,3-dioxygenase-like lactoylglutathione lyase family enzyme
MITGVLQIHINVKDIDRAVNFYVKVLGMRLVERPTPVWASLSLGGMEIGLFKRKILVCCGRSGHEATAS